MAGDQLVYMRSKSPMAFQRGVLIPQARSAHQPRAASNRTKAPPARRDRKPAVNKAGQGRGMNRKETPTVKRRPPKTNRAFRPFPSMLGVNMVIIG
jgi:hypothetical protein